jgi:hypothetical protein
LITLMKIRHLISTCSDTVIAALLVQHEYKEEKKQYNSDLQLPSISTAE